MKKFVAFAVVLGLLASILSGFAAEPAKGIAKSKPAMAKMAKPVAEPGMAKEPAEKKAPGLMKAKRHHAAKKAHKAMKVRRHHKVMRMKKHAKRAKRMMKKSDEPAAETK